MPERRGFPTGGEKFNQFKLFVRDILKLIHKDVLNFHIQSEKQVAEVQFFAQCV